MRRILGESDVSCHHRVRVKADFAKTLASQEDARASKEEHRMETWVNAGGNPEDSVTSPAALYITAILE